MENLLSALKSVRFCEKVLFLGAEGVRAPQEDVLGLLRFAYERNENICIHRTEQHFRVCFHYFGAFIHSAGVSFVRSFAGTCVRNDRKAVMR